MSGRGRGRRLRLNHPLVLEEMTRSPDGAGGFAGAWVALGTLWAAIEARTGREAAQDPVPVSATGYRITVRAAPTGSARRPRPDQRLRSGTRIFRILAVAEADPDARYLTCFAREEIPA